VDPIVTASEDVADKLPIVPPVTVTVKPSVSVPFAPRAKKAILAPGSTVAVAIPDPLM